MAAVMTFRHSSFPRLAPALVFVCLLVQAARAGEPLDDWLQRLALANHLADQGALDQAQALYAASLEEAQHDGGDVRVGLALHNLARLFDRKGELREAEKAYLRAASALMRAPDADPRLLVRVYAGLATVYIQTGEDSRGENLIRSVLASNPPADEAAQASLTGSLALILARKGLFAEAIPLLSETARRCALSQDAEMQEAGAVAAANLAGVQLHLGRLADALASYRQALAWMESAPRISPAAFAVTLAGYANALHRAGDPQAAAAHYRQAVAHAQTSLGDHHIVLADLLEQYSAFVRETGKKSEARQLAAAARRIQNAWNRDNLTGYTIEFGRLLVQK
jgi:tetratricopeptide (TPR) repeat protein